MRREDRLRALKVGVAREDHFAMPIREIQVRAVQGREPDIDPVQGVAGPELGVGRDLVVPAPRGVELSAHVAEFLDERGLDVHMHIFALQDERELPGFDLSTNFAQTPHNLLAFLGSQQANVGKHLRVRDRTPDVVLEKPTVKGDRFRELFDATVGFGAKPSAPWLACHARTPNRHDSCAQAFGTANLILGSGLSGVNDRAL
jgi:hypothetical protein